MCVCVSEIGECGPVPSHVYESICSYAEPSWRHLSDSKYNSLSRQVSPLFADTVETQWKASTLPRRRDRQRSDGPNTAIAETESGLVKYLSEPGEQHRRRKSPVDDLCLLEMVSKVNAAFKSELPPPDQVTDDVTQPEMEVAVSGSKRDDGPVYRRGRRSKRSVGATRRSSSMACPRRGKTGRKGPSSQGRVPPVGAASKSDWVRSPSPDSDEESYVTACNLTPLLSSRRDRGTQYPDNRKCNPRAGNGRRRRRPALKFPVLPVQPTTLEHPGTAVAPNFEFSPVLYVPPPAILLLFCIYVVCGAALFRQLYHVEDWSMAMYVSLAAILTIGGWYPDHDDASAVGEPWISWPPDPRYVYTLWLIVGLTLMSACLHLTIQAVTQSKCVQCCQRQASDDS